MDNIKESIWDIFVSEEYSDKEIISSLGDLVVWAGETIKTISKGE